MERISYEQVFTVRTWGGLILGILSTSITSQATVNSRRGNIQSHGALECINESGGDVYLDTSDLLFLADDIDSLETSYKTSLKEQLKNNGYNPPNDDWDTLLGGVTSVVNAHKFSPSNIKITNVPVNPDPDKYMCYFAQAYHHSSGGSPSVYGLGSYHQWGVSDLPYRASDEWLKEHEYAAGEYNIYLWCPF